MVFYRLKIISKTTNVADVDIEKKLREYVKIFKVENNKAVRDQDMYGPLPRVRMGNAATFSILSEGFVCRCI